MKNMPRKMELETILNKLYMDDLRSIAETCGLPPEGSKKDIIAKLISEILPEELLSVCFSVEQLKEILEAQGLPKSGNKDELVIRVLSSLKVPKAVKESKKEMKKTISTLKTASLADEVASYLKEIIIGSIKLRDESDLEKYLFGRIEEYFRGRDITIVSQAIGIKDRSQPDLELKRETETVIVELKYIGKKKDYEEGLTQATRYAGTQILV